ncbi:MAG: SMI1/KNR4 family protein [Ruminococcus sp.]|nr:SMI1/KNR4 family protein [Ruminococcus sp.]
MYIPEIPNNIRITEEIKKIISIAKAMEGIKRFSFNAPSTEMEILEVEQAINSSLPDEYKDILRFANGLTLNGFTVDFYNTSEIINNYFEEKEESFPDEYVIIGETIGDGEILCFSKTTEKFIRFFNGEEVIYETFKDVLNWMIRFIERIDEEYLYE